MPPTPTIILICQHCDWSGCFRRGELPERCPICHESGNWQVALIGQVTARDRRFLKGLRIAAE